MRDMWRQRGGNNAGEDTVPGGTEFKFLQVGCRRENEALRT